MESDSINHCSGVNCIAYFRDFHLPLINLYCLFILSPDNIAFGREERLSFKVLLRMGDSDICDTSSSGSSCQHLWIYGRAILTCARGLWTPVKCYFLLPFKWLDRKPSNRGINSEYWPVFLPAACPHGICSRLWRKGPLAQTFVWLRGANWAK